MSDITIEQKIDLELLAEAMAQDLDMDSLYNFFDELFCDLDSSLPPKTLKTFLIDMRACINGHISSIERAEERDRDRLRLIRKRTKGGKKRG